MNRQAFRRTSSLVLGLCLGAAVPASAQTTLDMTTSVLQHPSSGPNVISGNATQVALGRYSDDAIPDAAVLHGTNVHMAYAPDRRNVWSKATGSYTSIARLPGYGTGTARDAVIASTASGLSVLTYDASPSVRALVPTALSSTSSWINATDLEVVPHSAGLYELVGLAAGGSTLLHMTWNPSTDAFGTVSSFTVQSGTTAVAAINWDADSSLEYATANSTDLKLYDDNGTALTSPQGGGGADPILVAITDAASPRVAWMRSDSFGNEVLNVYVQGGTLETALYFYSADIKHMALADVDQEGLKELWLTSNALTLGLVLRRGTTSTFLAWPDVYTADLDAANSVYEQEPVAGTGVYGGSNTPPVPGVMDLDGDSDDDIFLAGHPGQANRALVCLGDKYNEERDILNGGRVKPWLTYYSFQITGSPGAQTGNFSFAFPSKPTGGPASAATHVRYVVWSQAVGATEVTYVQHLESTLGPGYPPPQLITVPNIHQLGNGALLHLEVSYLKYENGIMTAAWPALMETLSVDLLNSSAITYWDRVWLAYLAGKQEDGTSVGGSTARPPISPPTGGVTP